MSMVHDSKLLKRGLVVLIALSVLLSVTGCDRNEPQEDDSPESVVETPKEPEYVTTTQLSDDEVGVFVGEITGCGTICSLQLDEIIHYSNEGGFECATTVIAFSRRQSAQFADKVGGVIAVRGSVSAYRGNEQIMFNDCEILDEIDMTNAHFESILSDEWDLMDTGSKARAALVLMDYLLAKSDYFDSVDLRYSEGTVENLQDGDMEIEFTPGVYLNGVKMPFTWGGAGVGAILNLFVSRDGVEFLINNTRSWKYNWEAALDVDNSENTEGQDFATFVRDFYVSETTVESPNVQISEDQAYQIALAQWVYNPEYVDPRTGKEVVIEKMGIVGSAIGYFYLFRMYTIDHEFVKSAYIDVETGEYFPDVMDAEI